MGNDRLQTGCIDRTSLFQCYGQAPDKSTVKRRFRAISVTMRWCNTNAWRHCGSLATFALAAEQFPSTPPPRRCSHGGRERKGSMQLPRRFFMSLLLRSLFAGRSSAILEKRSPINNSLQCCTNPLGVTRARNAFHISTKLRRLNSLRHFSETYPEAICGGFAIVDLRI